MCVSSSSAACMLEEMPHLTVLPLCLQLCLGALSQPLSGCIRLLCPGALDPVCDLPVLLFPPTSLRPKLLSACHLHRRPGSGGPPASRRPADGGRGPWWRHGDLRRRTQRLRRCHERRAPSGGQGSGVQLHPTSLQALQFARTLPTGECHLGKHLCVCRWGGG